MKRTFAWPLVLFSLLTFSCQQVSKYGQPIARPEVITKSTVIFSAYWYKYVRLGEDYTALDSAENILDKGLFLKALMTGRYLPLRLTTKDSSAYYQLYPFENANGDIKFSIQRWSEQLYSNYQKEGKTLPGLPWVDVKGNVYNVENTKGKILVLKCWFVHCLPCVKEMPALNELVRDYSNRKDILFVSLAFDKKSALDSFLAKTKFDYATVAEKKAYMIDTLGIMAWPRHILVNKQGIISKVLNDKKELAIALKKEAAKQPAL